MAKIETLGYKDNFTRPTLVEVHIADIHFGAFDPKVQYEILEAQFLNKIRNFKFDILSIDGDLFHHKCMSNSDIAMYATLFIDQCYQICKNSNATLVIITGTREHDADQLKLFYHYLNNNDVDIRIIEQPKMEYIKGAKILCIPEMYNLDEDVYTDLFYKEIYDSVFMHGTYKGSVYGDNVGYSRLFTKQDFFNCTGPIISGHVHTPGCYDGHVYYTGCPYRWCYGQEENKGFLIVIHDLQRQLYTAHMEFIESPKYITVSLDSIIEDPKATIQYINNMKESMNADHLRVKIISPVSADNTSIIKNYYRTNPYIDLVFDYNVKLEKAKYNMDSMRELDEYDYIMDKSLSPYEILRRYINQKEQQEIFISGDELKKIIEDELL